MKVGDRVKIKKGDMYYAKFKGMIGVIINDETTYDWNVEFGNDYEPFDEKFLELVRKRGRPSKPKLVKYIAKYDENDVDPYKEFHSRKELMKWIKKAQKASDIDFSSILVFPVLEPKKVTTKFGLRKV